jgi:hypothetical protein
MPDILSGSQKAERELAEALKEFLPEQLEWKDIGGYPVLYRKGFFGSFKGVAFLSSGKKITILSRSWKAAILETLRKYKEVDGITIEVNLGFTEPKKYKKGDRYAN